MARVGIVVVVLGDLGRYGEDGREAVVRHLAAPAVARAGWVGYRDHGEAARYREPDLAP